MNDSYRRFTFPNQLRAVVGYMPHLRSVSTMVFVGTGSRYETDAEAGVSHFIEHLYFKGTSKRPTSKDISEAIETVGGILNGATDKELTNYWAKVADRHFPVALDLLSDIIHNSTLDQVEMEKERQIIIEEINMSFDLPQFKVDLLMDELMWKGQAMGRDVAGTRETVAAITRAQILDYIGRRYRPNNTVVAITGNIEPDRACEMVAAAFGEWTAGQPEPMVPAAARQVAPQVAFEYRDCEQAHICLGVPGMSLFNPDRFALGLLSVILGEGMSSRLFIEIRDRRGLAYDIRSYTAQHLDTGSFVIYAGVAPKQAHTTVAAIMEQLHLMKEVVSAKELDKAKETAKGRLLLRMEDSRNVGGWLGVQETLCGRIMGVDEVVSLIDRVTPADVKRVAESLLVTEKLNLAIVGPVRRKASLERLLKF